VCITVVAIIGREGPNAVRIGVQRVTSRVVERLVGILLKFAVQWGPRRDIFPRVFFPPGVVAVDDVVGASAQCEGDFCREDGGR
jgi:hypothetical protein